MLRFTPLWLLPQQVGRSRVREWCLEGRLGGTFYSSLFLSRYYQYYGTLAVKSTVWSVSGQWVSACAPRAPCAVLWKPTLQDCIGREPAASLGRTLDGEVCCVTLQSITQGSCVFGCCLQWRVCWLYVLFVSHSLKPKRIGMQVGSLYVNRNHSA